MFGVKGNVALAGVLFCCQHLFKKEAWNEGLVRNVFWSLNGGLVLMMFLDLFPAGLYQMMMVITNGLWYARSSAVTEGAVFTFLTYMRMIGGAVFVFGGLLPLMWFIISRGTQLQREVEVAEGEWSVYDKDWAAQEESRAIGDD
jgi:nitric oxide reductase subunit B